jgi:hypothetical protein
MTDQNNAKIIMNHNGTQSYQFQSKEYLLIVKSKIDQVQRVSYSSKLFRKIVFEAVTQIFLNSY